MNEISKTCGAGGQASCEHCKADNSPDALFAWMRREGIERINISRDGVPHPVKCTYDGKCSLATPNVQIKPNTAVTVSTAKPLNNDVFYIYVWSEGFKVFLKSKHRINSEDVRIGSTYIVNNTEFSEYRIGFYVSDGVVKCKFEAYYNGKRNDDRKDGFAASLKDDAGQPVSVDRLTRRVS